MGNQNCCETSNTNPMSECITSNYVGNDKVEYGQNKDKKEAQPINKAYFDDDAISDNIRDYEQTFLSGSKF